MTDICLICLKQENVLLIVKENDVKSEEILSKLEKCVPEVEWKNSFSICKSCLDNLNKAYEFKQLCISSCTAWKNIYSIKLKENHAKNSSNTDSDSFADDDNHFEESEENCIECFQCKTTFKTKTLLEKHIAYKHEAKKKTFRKKCVCCEFCMKMYANKNALQKHLKVCKSNVNGDNSSADIKLEDSIINIKTEQCLLTKLDHVINDKDLHETDNKIPPTCSLCGTTFCNKYLLKRHLQNVHATEKKFKCDICESTFASTVYLNAHKRYHVGDRSHICSFCGKGFITASDLYHHEKIHANKRAYRCEICPKAFNTSSDLHKHKICVHLDRSEWKYVCTYCQRRFPLKTNLDTHVKTHTGEKNYACHLCDRRCINKSVLMRHIETHSNVIAFKCNLCMQGYKYRKSLGVHMAKIHGIGNVKVPERTKKFFCHLCPKSYFANNKLQKHIRSHSGERPFHCPHCKKSFVDKSYIKQHLKSVHNAKLEDM